MKGVAGHSLRLVMLVMGLESEILGCGGRASAGDEGLDNALREPRRMDKVKKTKSILADV